MKTKNNARILAWLVSICMIFALIPAMPAEYAQAADEVITYNFLNLNSGNAYFLVDGAVNSKFTSFDHVTDGNGKWKYFSHDDSKTNGNAFFQSNAYGLYMKSTADANYQLLLYFDGNGYFSVDAKIGDWNELTGATLSLIPCDENGGNQGTAIELGKIDGTSASGGKWNLPTHVGKTSLTSGYYILNIYNDFQNGDHDITIIGSLSFTKLNLDVNVEPAAPVAIGKSVTTEVKLADPSDLATEIDCTAVSATSSLASFSLNDEGNLVVTSGNTAGSEVVAVTFTANDKSETVNMPITVYDPEDYTAATYEYNFYKGNKYTDLSTSVTSYNLTSDGATGEIKSGISTAPWKFESSTVPFTFDVSHVDGYGIFVRKSGTAKVRFYLPSSGIYNLFSSSRTHSAYTSTINFSLQRADGTGAYATSTSIGTIDTTGSGAQQTETFQIGSSALELEAGEYILTYDITVPTSNFFFPLSFSLVGLGGPEIVASSDIATTLSVGGSSSSSFSVEFNNTTQNATIKVESKNEEVTSVSESGGAYTFKALKEGFAKIVVTGTFGTPAITCTKEYGIVVRNPQAAGSAPVYYFSGMIHDSTPLFSDSNKDKNADEKLEDVITYDSTKSNNSSPWKIYGAYRSRLSENGSAARNTIVNPDNITVTNDGGTSNVQIGIKVPVSGYYTITTDADFENAEAKGKLTIYSETASGLNSSSPVYTQQMALKDVFNVNNPIYLEAEGSETAITNYRFYFESSSEDITLYSMTLTPYTKPEISTHEIFGSKYAYVTENADSTYNVSFIGGLHAIVGYESAGFEVYKDGTKVADSATQLAYKNLQYTANSQTVTKTPSDYGVADETGYIFIAKANVLEGNSAYAFTAGTYTIKPYVVKNGAREYHNDLTLVIG